MNNLKKLREEKNLTNNDLSVILNLDLSRLENLENGTERPNFEETKILSEFYGVSYADLYSQNIDTKAPVQSSNPQPRQQSVRAQDEFEALRDASTMEAQPIQNYGRYNSAPNNYGYQNQYNYGQQNQYNYAKPTKSYKNPKKLNLWLLIITAVALICYFALPIFSDSADLGMLGTFSAKATFMDMFSTDGKYIFYAIMVLLSYIYLVINAIIMLSLPKVVRDNKYFPVGKILNLILSLLAALFGFIEIFSIGFTGISVITLAILIAIAVIGIMVFIKSINMDYEAELEAEKNKKQPKIVHHYTNPKSLIITNLILTIILSGLTFYVAYYSDFFYSDFFDIYAWFIIISGLYTITNDIICLVSNKIRQNHYGFISKIFNVFVLIAPCLYLFLGHRTVESYFILGALIIAYLVVYIIHLAKSKKID